MHIDSFVNDVAFGVAHDDHGRDMNLLVFNDKISQPGQEASFLFLLFKQRWPGQLLRGTTIYRAFRFNDSFVVIAIILICLNASFDFLQSPFSHGNISAGPFANHVAPVGPSTNSDGRLGRQGNGNNRGYPLRMIFEGAQPFEGNMVGQKIPQVVISHRPELHGIFDDAKKCVGATVDQIFLQFLIILLIKPCQERIKMLRRRQRDLNKRRLLGVARFDAF
ncbi:hypothetical protein DFS34DRAFT_601680 [Phlyctochytrium arcticum]|nr:hypothetical protein DFS34DRAFT_601680 [Phlyctochytrium arcticum]